MSVSVRVRGIPILPDVIIVAIRWCLRYELSYRDVEELLVEHGIAVVTRRCYDHFARCQACARVYWHGARSRHLAPLVRAATVRS
jgi:uncharacterized protein with PIN domain